MKRLLAWTGSADSTITSEAVMAMAEKFNTGQEVCLQIPSARRVMQVKEGTSGSKGEILAKSRADVFRFGPNSGYHSIGAACPFG